MAVAMAPLRDVVLRISACPRSCLAPADLACAASPNATSGSRVRYRRAIALWDHVPRRTGRVAQPDGAGPMRRWDMGPGHR